MSLRSLMRSLVLPALLAATLALLQATPAAAAKNTLTIGLVVEPEGLDPTIAAPTTIREVTWLNIYEGLVRLDENGHVLPLLAKSWTISDDGLTYTFKLQPGVKFHDGTPFDSSIVKFSLDRARAPDSTNAQKQFFEPIDSIETPDPLTAVIRLKHPTGLFLYWLGWGDSVMVAPKSVPTNKTHPVGTGPFRFKQWVQGDHIVLERNPDYWQKGKPKLDTVTFRFISDAQAQAAALRAGDVDAFPEFSAAELFASFEKDSRFATLIGATPNKLIAGMNNARKPFNDVRVRRAISMAIDRPGVIDATYEGVGTMNPAVPMGLKEWALPVEQLGEGAKYYKYDPARARKLLAEAGVPSGFPATISYATYGSTIVMDQLQLILKYLKDVGIDAKPNQQEYGAYISTTFYGKYESMAFGPQTPFLDPDNFLYGPHVANELKNQSHVDDPVVTDLLVRQRRTMDPGKRREVLFDIQRHLAKQQWYVYLPSGVYIGVWDGALKNYGPNLGYDWGGRVTAAWLDR